MWPRPPVNTGWLPERKARACCSLLKLHAWTASASSAPPPLSLCLGHEAKCVVCPGSVGKGEELHFAEWSAVAGEALHSGSLGHFSVTTPSMKIGRNWTRSFQSIFLELTYRHSVFLNSSKRYSVRCFLRAHLHYFPSRS